MWVEELELRFLKKAKILQRIYSQWKCTLQSKYFLAKRDEKKVYPSWLWHLVQNQFSFKNYINLCIYVYSHILYTHKHKNIQYTVVLSIHEGLIPGPPQPSNPQPHPADTKIYECSSPWSKPSLSVCLAFMNVDPADMKGLVVCVPSRK